MKLCAWCNKKPVIDNDPSYWTCQECLDKREAPELPGEWTRATNVERRTHEKDILQPLKKDGTINKKFVAAHGTKSLEKEFKVSKQDILKNVEKYG